MKTIKNMTDMLHEADTDIGADWANDRVSLEFTDDEAKIATVLTRLDIALDASINAYNGKILESINTGIWILIGLSILHLIVLFFQ